MIIYIYIPFMQNKIKVLIFGQNSEFEVAMVSGY